MIFISQKWKWEDVNMDFVVCLHRTRRQHDYILIIVDRLCKFSYFLHIKLSFLEKKYDTLYVKEIVKWHGAPMSTN